MRSMLLAAGVLAGVTIMASYSAAAPGGNGNGNGNAFGFGFGGGLGKGGRGGGGPLPALGATLIGQAVGAGGVFVLWRRRRKKR